MVIVLSPRELDRRLVRFVAGMTTCAPSRTVEFDAFGSSGWWGQTGACPHPCAGYADARVVLQRSPILPRSAAICLHEVLDAEVSRLDELELGLEPPQIVEVAAAAPRCRRLLGPLDGLLFGSIEDDESDL